MEGRQTLARPGRRLTLPPRPGAQNSRRLVRRSEEHTSELQSLRHLVCRLLLEKKKKKKNKNTITERKKKKKKTHHEYQTVPTKLIHIRDIKKLDIQQE